ncbi:uncharacterized protein [Narcine bancroftii]|uniref:uncharacterized protein isoform X2 n=1 Tax=Narcine bancroftii TaxID=1343680 RepID=UPI0038321823
MNVYKTAHDSKRNCWFSNKKSELDHLLNNDINLSSNLEAPNANKLEIKDLEHTKLYENISETTKRMDLSKDYFLVTSDNAHNSSSNLINQDKPTEDGIKLDLDGYLESDKILCRWCGYYTFNKLCFEDHLREQHRYFEFGKEIPASSMKLQCFGTENNCLNSQVHSTNDISLKRKRIVKKRKSVNSEREKHVRKNSSTLKIDGCKTSKSMPKKSPTGRRKPPILSTFKNCLLYVKRLCLFHCILCHYRTLFHNCILRHVKSVHGNPSGHQKFKSHVCFSNGLRTSELCKKGHRAKGLSSKYNLLPYEGNNIGIRSESRNIDTNCETSLQQVNNQLQFSVPHFANHLDANIGSEISPTSIGVPLYFSTIMSPIKKRNDIALSKAASSKCLVLEAIVKSLKNRMRSPIKCVPAVPLLNDRSARRKQTIPYCRTTEEQKAKWMLEPYSFLSQQKIEFSTSGDDCLYTGAEIEVVLSDAENDNDERTYSNPCKNDCTLSGKFAKLAEDETKMLCSTTDKMKLGAMYKCSICAFSHANISNVLLHYHEKHPEESNIYKRNFKYSCKSPVNILTKRDFPLSTCSELLFDSESSDPSHSCLDASSKLCLCKHCSYTGDWVSLSEHYQRIHLSKNESENQILNYLPVRAQLAVPSISKSKAQLVFECQECNFTCSSRRVICRHYCIKQSIACAQVEDSEIVFKCALCMFTHLIRAGLVHHYLVFHNIEPSHRCYREANNALGSLLSINDELKAGMEKQICILCFFKAITQKELVFHYKLRHFKFYSQNKCTIGCKKINLSTTNLHPFDEINILKENGSEYVNAVMDREMCPEPKTDVKIPLKCSTAEELELISYKGSENFMKSLAISGKLGDESNTSRRKNKNSFSLTMNSMNMMRFQDRKHSLSSREHLGCNIVMPEDQNIDSSDNFSKTGDPLMKLSYKGADQKFVLDDKDRCLQENLVPENKIVNGDHSVKEACLKFAVNQSIAMGEFNCRYCTQLFKALTDLRNHEKAHFLSKNCHHSATKSRKPSQRNQEKEKEGKEQRKEKRLILKQYWILPYGQIIMT